MSQAPKSECFRHNFMLRGRCANSASGHNSEAPAFAREADKPATSAWSGLRDSQIETNKQGRRVLVNEMRIADDEFRPNDSSVNNL
jgi:hypothetical protein